MGVMRGWTICDRCSFKYRRGQMFKEATGWVVCRACNDGLYDAVRHPQNKSAKHRKELVPIPDGRPMDNPPVFSIGLEDGGFLLTEALEKIDISNQQYSISQSVYIGV
jgi:hypothetical protein